MHRVMDRLPFHIGSQNLSYSLIDYENFMVQQAGLLPLARGHTLIWIGITDEGVSLLPSYEKISADSKRVSGPSDLRYNGKSSYLDQVQNTHGCNLGPHYGYQPARAPRRKERVILACWHRGNRSHVSDLEGWSIPLALVIFPPISIISGKATASWFP
jgi:hypothetical protein